MSNTSCEVISFGLAKCSRVKRFLVPGFSPQLFRLIHHKSNENLKGKPPFLVSQGNPAQRLHRQTRNSDATLSSPHRSPSSYSSDDSSGAVEKSNFSASDLQLKWAYLTREGIVLIQADQEPESNFYGKKVCFNRQILKANSQIAQGFR